jgi:hypothetical protein
MASYRDRLKKLFSAREFRLNQLIFLLVGAFLFSISFLIPDKFWADVVKDFAITFVAVAVVQFLWNVLGGDPLELEIKTSTDMLNQELDDAEARLGEHITSVNKNVDTLKDSLYLLADLIDGNIGIERLWPERRKWRDDDQAGLEVWHEWVCQADDVTIISNTLWNSWMHHETFREKFFENLKRGANIKIVVFHPTSPLLELRAKDEKDPKTFGVQQMQSEIISTLSLIVEMLDNVEDNARKRFEVRLMHDYMLLSQIIRADDRMLVALYLSGKTGSPSPTFQIKGTQTKYFQKYLEQTDIHWERSEKLDFNELKELLNKFEGQALPPQEA